MSTHPDSQTYYAYRCKHAVDGSPYYSAASTSLFFVKNHFFKDPIVTLRVRERMEGDPPSTYWGWLATARPEEYQFIWYSEKHLDICFTYGIQSEIDRGRGRKVNLMLEEVSP